MANQNPTSSNTSFFKMSCSAGTDRDFEWTWDKTLSNDYVDLVNNDRDVRFHHHISNGTAVVRGNKPLLADQHFWEVEMISPVYGTDMMIGVGTPEADVSQVQDRFISFLGMNNQTWGLSYTGLFHHDGESKGYSHPFGQGSVIGVHLDLWNGTLSYYKNKKHLGIATRGLKGKTLYAMASSTAACSGMRIVSSRSFPSSLQFLCCAKLRDIIPDKKSVLKELQLPPGLRLFLSNNLSWLLDPRHSEAQLYHTRNRRGNNWVSLSSGMPAMNHFMFHENNIEIEAPIDLNSDTLDARDTFYVVGRRPFILCCYNRFRRDSNDSNGQASTSRQLRYPVENSSTSEPEASAHGVVSSQELPDNSEASTSGEENDSLPESDAKRRRYSYNYLVGLSDPDSE